MLSDSDFQKLIELGPLVSIDFVIENDKQEVLVGVRNNAPAKGFYFVPGGRIRKNESFDQAALRISKTELGAEIGLKDLSPIGFFEQIYNENFYQKEGLTTHYVALVYRYPQPWTRPIDLDSQHQSYVFMPKDELARNPQVHENCRAYFE
ncbi:NUDIX domain-containing protein [bacterium]|nr:NUDIX domain-containing protein [bacterium]